jgi:hypothetical protein
MYIFQSTTYAIRIIHVFVGNSALRTCSFEAAGAVCFERSLGCLNGGSAEEQAQNMVDANKRIFRLSAYLKFSLPLYKHIPTPKWKKLVAAEDQFYGLV